MTKTTGLNSRLFVGGYNISGDTGALDNVKHSTALQDVTGIDKSAHERIALLRDGEMGITTFYNASIVAGSEGAHTVLKALPTSDIVVTFFVGSAVGNEAASMVAKQVNYDITRNADGSLSMKTQAMANGYGLEWYDQLTAGHVTHASATNGTSIDTTSSASFGGAAVWHVMSIDSGTVGGEIQDSADNVTFAAVSGLTFTALSAAGGERKQTTALTTTMRRYLRFASTGTFTNAVLAAAVVKHVTATSY